MALPVRHPWRACGLPAALLVLVLAGPAAAQDDELATLRAKKLAEPFLKTARWLTDYDAALAAAAPAGTPTPLIFAYFTRSYAANAECSALERGLLSSREFADWAAGYVLLAHITTRVAGDPRQDLLKRKGGIGFPYFVFMDASGAVLAAHAGERSIEAFRATAARATARAEELARLAAAATGDPAQRVGLFMQRLALRAYVTVDQARDACTQLAPQVPAAEQALLDFEIEVRLSGFRTPSDQMSAGKDFAALVRAGKEPAGDASTVRDFWFIVAMYAADTHDIAAMERALTALRTRLADNAGAMGLIKKWEGELSQWKQPGAK